MSDRNEMFDHFLDECYPTVNIVGIDFYPADVLFECDPIAYRVAMNDWFDAQCSDGIHNSISEGYRVCDWCGEKVEDEDAENPL